MRYNKQNLSRDLEYLVGDLGFELILEEPEAPDEIAPVPKKAAPQPRKARRGVAVAKAKRKKGVN